MQCPRCQAENRAGRRFCGECGLSFASECERLAAQLGISIPLSPLAGAE